MTREERIRTAINQLPSIVPSELDDAWLLNGEYVSKESLVPVVAALFDAERARVWVVEEDGHPIEVYVTRRDALAERREHLDNDTGCDYHVVAYERVEPKESKS